jgi:S-adenosylmethionine decarboxylase proenzyme
VDSQNSGNFTVEPGNFLFKIEQFSLQPIRYSFRQMPANIAPVLYSVDLSECAAMSHLTTEEICERFTAVLEGAGATILHAVSHTFQGAGLTCALLLSESHAVLHTWPETGTVNLDIFSCSTRLKSLDAIGELGRLFGAGAVSIQEIPRADGHHPGIVTRSA